MQSMREAKFRVGVVVLALTGLLGTMAGQSSNDKLEAGFHDLAARGISEKLLRARCLLSSSCGMGLMVIEDAEKAMTLLAELSRSMREKYPS